MLKLNCPSAYSSRFIFLSSSAKEIGICSCCWWSCIVGSVGGEIVVKCVVEDNEGKKESGIDINQIKLKKVRKWTYMVKMGMGILLTCEAYWTIKIPIACNQIPVIGWNNWNRIQFQFINNQSDYFEKKHKGLLK